MISQTDIEATAAFQSVSDKFKQKLLTRTDNRKKIEHGVNVSRNIGFDTWEQNFNPTGINKTIVQQLLIIKS